MYFAAIVLSVALPAQAQSELYRALGTEPFWSLTIDAATMRYEPADGGSITVPKPRMLTGINGERYQTPTLTVSITRVRCSDGMSDRIYRDTVTVRAGGATRNGCGGPILSSGPAKSLLEGEWTVTAIEGRPVLRGTAPRVTFRGGRLQGETGCSRFSGGFEFAQGHLQAGPLATTRRGCVGNGVAAQERRLLALLGQKLSVSRNPSDKLVMTSHDRRTLVLVPQR